jgi:hypothetical protein
MGEMAVRWLENAGERRSIQQLLPGAKSVTAGKQGSKKGAATDGKVFRPSNLIDHQH